MWLNWKKRRRTTQEEESKRKTAETIFDAARAHLDAAERLHDIIDGGESNEEFDATK